MKVIANHFLDPRITLSPNVGTDKSWVWGAFDFSDNELIEQVRLDHSTDVFMTASTPSIIFCNSLRKQIISSSAVLHIVTLNKIVAFFLIPSISKKLISVLLIEEYFWLSLSFESIADFC